MRRMHGITQSTFSVGVAIGPSIVAQDQTVLDNLSSDEACDLKPD